MGSDCPGIKGNMFQQRGLSCELGVFLLSEKLGENSEIIHPFVYQTFHHKQWLYTHVVLDFSLPVAFRFWRNFFF